MLTTPTPKRKPKRGPNKFPGIVEAAEIFGVDRVTLYRALMGQFPDHHNLRGRYAAFLRKRSVGK